MMRFSSGVARPIGIFSSSRAEAACKFETSLSEDADLAFWLLSSSPATVSGFLDVKDESVKVRPGPDEFDLGVFELLSEVHVPSKDAMMRFSSGVARPIGIFSSSRAEAACKFETSLSEDADLAFWLLSSSPATVSGFLDEKDESVKVRPGSDVFDLGVFELLSEVHVPSKDALMRFSTGAARPIGIFSSSRAEAACKVEMPLLEDADLDA